MTLPAKTSARRKVLIVSPAFAPINTPDSQRVRMSLSYYGEYGWDAVVLRTEPGEVDGPREEDLLKTLPSGVRIESCSALSRSIASILGLGNLGWRSVLPMFWKGLQLLQSERFDLVFFSTTQFAVFPLGRIWQELTGTPYAIDLQDPWRTDYYEQPGVRKPPGGWKYRFARLQAVLLEEWSLRKLSGFIAVSPEYIGELSARYSWFSKIPAAAVRFGVSEIDQEVARRQPESIREAQNGQVNLVYTGAAGPIMPHATRILFTALKQFQQSEPVSAGRLRLRFLGTSYAPAERAQATILPLAEEMGVAQLIEEVPQRLGHLECLELQRSADGLLLLGSSDPAYSPSKLYPYYLAERPILAVVFQGSDLIKLLDELQCSSIALCDSPDVFGQALQLIQGFFRKAISGFDQDDLGRRDRVRFEKTYSARALTSRQAELFNRALDLGGHDARVY